MINYNRISSSKFEHNKKQKDHIIDLEPIGRHGIVFIEGLIKDMELIDAADSDARRILQEQGLLVKDSDRLEGSDIVTELPPSGNRAQLEAIDIPLNQQLDLNSAAYVFSRNYPRMYDYISFAARLVSNAIQNHGGPDPSAHISKIHTLKLRENAYGSSVIPHYDSDEAYSQHRILLYISGQGSFSVHPDEAFNSGLEFSVNPGDAVFIPAVTGSLSDEKSGKRLHSVKNLTKPGEPTRVFASLWLA